MSDAQNSGKQRGRPFEKGDKRINRGGRPKGYESFRESFRGETDINAIQKRLRDLILDGEGSESISASKLWLEYGFGKAPAAPDDNEAVREGLTVVVQSLAEKVRK